MLSIEGRHQDAVAAKLHRRSAPSRVPASEAYRQMSLLAVLACRGAAVLALKRLEKGNLHHRLIRRHRLSRLSKCSASLPRFCLLTLSGCLVCLLWLCTRSPESRLHRQAPALADIMRNQLLVRRILRLQRLRPKKYPLLVRRVPQIEPQLSITLGLLGLSFRKAP